MLKARLELGYDRQNYQTLQFGQRQTKVHQNDKNISYYTFTLLLNVNKTIMGKN
jgi:hypothetical protein